MDIWNILGIAATTDKAAIQAAYREKLTGTNPEDKPEEFKQLRAAYEQALKLVKQSAENSSHPLTESERWLDRLNTIYMDIALRQDTECWKQLLAEDFCMNLATRSQARDGLLRYLMKHYFLPQPVWLLLDEFFSLRENRSELMESFPRDFIEHAVYAGIDNDELLPYHALNGPGDACDEWMRLYGRFRSAVGSGDTNAMTQMLQEMEQSAAWHPYLLLCRARAALAAEPADLTLAAECAEQLLMLLPGDTQALLLAGDCAMQNKEYAKANEIWVQLLEATPGYAQVQFNRIECLIAMERYLEAKELSVKLSKKLPNNPVVIAQMHAINKTVLPLREKMRAEEPDNVDNLIELAWCYNQESRCKDALQVLRSLPGETMQGEYEYENLAAKVYLGNQMPQQALPHLRRWERAIRNLPDTEENAEKKARLPESIRLQAMVCEQLELDSDADALYFLLQEQYPDDVGSLQQLAQRALRKHEYEIALQFAEHLVDLADYEAFGHFMMAAALYHLHRLQDSYNAFNETMHRAGRDGVCLSYQCRILMDVGQWDDARNILDDLVKADFKTPDLDYIRGRFAQHEARYGDAADLFEKLVKDFRSHKDDLPDFAGEVFYRLAGLKMDTAPKEELLALVEDGLHQDPNGLSLLEMKADLLRQMERPQEAIDILKHLHTLPYAPQYICESLGRIYHFYLRDYKEAAAWYEKQLAAEETAEVYNLLGLVLQEQRLYEDSEQAFANAMKLDPDCSAYVANRAALRLLAGDWVHAEMWYLEALKMDDLNNATRARLHRDLARLYYRNGNYPQGMLWLERNVKELHEYGDLAEIAEGHARRMDLKGALKALREWQKLTGADEADYLRRKGDLLAKCRQPRKALTPLRRAAGGDIASLQLLGVMFADLGHYRTAEYLLRRLLKLDPEREDAYAWLAKALLWQGKKEEAQQVAEQGMILLKRDMYDLNSAMFYARLTIYLALLNRPAEARAALDEVKRVPLCRFCSYGSCKDAQWAEAFLIETEGDLNEALRLYVDGTRNHPDEYDFSAGVRRLRKRIQRNYDHRH